MKFLNKTITLVIAAAFGVSACGGGGGGGTPARASAPAALIGNAAVGSPIVGAFVSVVCANGQTAVSQPTNSIGMWQVALASPVFPCAVQLNGGTINGVQNTQQLHSIAVNPGILNVTPLTDLMLAMTVHASNLSYWFSTLQASGLQSVNPYSLRAALIAMINVLNIGQLSMLDPMTTSFAPVRGDMFDDTLAALAATIDSLGISYTSLQSQLAAQAPVIPAGFAAAISSYYATVSSGYSITPVVVAPTTPVVVAPIIPTGANITTGLAVNGAPKVSPAANCAQNAGGGAFLQCQPGAIANFGPFSVQDAKTGQTCTATYVDGTLTVSNGSATVTSFLNGTVFSELSVYSAGASITPNMLNTWTSANVSAFGSVNWNMAGAVTSISAQSFNPLLSVVTQVICSL